MQIKIKDFTFEITAPYVEGQALGIAEARVLNSIRADNIRNAVLRKLDKLRSEAGLLTPEGLLQLEAYVRDVDHAYVFPLDGRMQVEMISIQREAEALAGAKARREAGERGLGEDEDWIEQRALFLSKSEEVLAAARRNIEAKKEVARQALRELLE